MYYIISTQKQKEIQSVFTKTDNYIWTTPTKNTTQTTIKTRPTSDSFLILGEQVLVLEVTRDEQDIQQEERFNENSLFMSENSSEIINYLNSFIFAYMKENEKYQLRTIGKKIPEKEPQKKEEIIS